MTTSTLITRYSRTPCTTLSTTHRSYRQPYFPDIKWAPLEELQVTDRGLFADPEKKALLSAATKVQNLTPAIGTELSGIDLRQLSAQQKDELYVIELPMSCLLPTCSPYALSFRAVRCL